MTHPEIKFEISKSPGGICLSFDSLTVGEARALLITLNRLQLYRAAGIDADEAEGYSSPTTTEEVAAALGIDPFPKTAGPCFGPRLVTKLAHFDHKYEPGAFGVCKRCGGEKH